MYHKAFKIRTSLIFIWLGFVLAISFMEAWLKFQAPGITTELGLGIGRLVFGALNKVEIACLLIILLSVFLSGSGIRKNNSILIVLTVILLAQTLYLLPELDRRAIAIIEGQNVPESNLHLYYVLLEVVKVICLAIYGIQHLTSLNYGNSPTNSRK